MSNALELFEHFIFATMEQLMGMFTASGFSSSTYPREGTVHWFSGLSGILYLLPALTRGRMSFFGRMAWVVQALLSMGADYFFMGLGHPVHGFDRFFAVANAIRVLAFDFSVPHKVLGCLVPFGSHLLARVSKKEGDWKSWMFYHGEWY
jgi:hypothetical protein